MISNDAAVSLPLFLVHDGMVGVGALATLVEQAVEGMPVHGLCTEAAGAGHPLTIEGMATRLVEALRRRQPNGPYRIAGAGAAGVLAYEMAGQLVGRDETVEFIGLIDTPYPAWRGGADAGEEAEAAGKGDRTAPALARALTNYAIQPLPLTLHLFVSSCSEPLPPSSGGTSVGPTGWESLVPRVRRWNGAGTASGRASGLACIGSDIASTASLLWQALRDAPCAAAPLAERQHGAHVVIQTGRRGQAPVLCVPGAGDSVIGFIPLSEALGAEFALHGLQPRGVEGQLVPHATVEAAATFYLAATAALRASKPVHLIGHSFGGWVVFEMASQLLAAGMPVASLTIVDSESPDGIGVLGSEYTSTAVLIELMRVMELSAGQRMGIDAETFARCGRAEQLRLLHAGMVGLGLLPRRSDVSAIRGVTRTFATALRTTYRPARPYPGPVALVLARDLSARDRFSAHSQAGASVTADALAGWKRWAPDLTVWMAPGDHFSILRQPHVRALAQWWQGSHERRAAKPLAELSRVG